MTTITVTVPPTRKISVKHIAGGVDQEQIDVIGTRTFELMDNMGENVLVFGVETSDTHMEEVLDVQEQTKRDNEAKAGIPSQRKEELALAAQTGREIPDELKYDPATAEKLDNLHDQEIVNATNAVTQAESEKAQTDINAEAASKTKGSSSGTSAQPAKDNSPQSSDDTVKQNIAAGKKDDASDKSSATAGTKSTDDTKKS